MASHIDDLPDEILEYILNLIPPYKDLKECKLVSKRWFQSVKYVIKHRDAYFQKSVGLGSLVWNSLPNFEDSWSATIGKRHSHSACIYENSMYVFGGSTKSCTTFNDMWKFDLDTRKWERPIPMGTYPSPKACATMVYYDKSFILFGGWANPSTYPPYQTKKLFNELHIYSITTNKWTVAETLVGPPPTSGHSATVHGNLMVVFGGVRDYFNMTNDVWCFNLETHEWYQQPTLNPKPHPRYGQSQIVLDDQNLLILGGCTAHNVGMNDVWLLSMTGDNWTWTKISILEKDWAPNRIWCHQACKVGDHVIILSKKKLPAAQTPNVSSSGKVMCRGPMGLAKADVRGKIGGVGPPVVDRDDNVNGKRGRFTFRPQLHPAERPDRGSAPLERRWMLTLEERQTAMHQQELARKKINRLGIFILNIGNVLAGTASWVHHVGKDYTGPEERILYSLVLGKGELIFFGGIRKFTMVHGQNDVENLEVYNDVHVINPPAYSI